MRPDVRGGCPGLLARGGVVVPRPVEERPRLPDARPAAQLKAEQQRQLERVAQEKLDADAAAASEVTALLKTVT